MIRAEGSALHMPNYFYKAQNEAGEISRGILRAASVEHLETSLLVQGKRLLFWKPLPKLQLLAPRTLPPHQTAAFCRTLGTLLEAGIPVVSALEILEQESALPAVLKRNCHSMREAVRCGSSLSEAMTRCAGAFPRQLIQTFRSAEHTGTLGKSATQMAVQYGKEARIRQAMYSSMSYPVFLVGMTMAVLVILMTFVVPQFASLFANLQPLPLSTRILLAINDGVQRYWRWILLVVLLVLLVFSLLGRNPAVRKRRDRRKLHLPLVGTVYRKLCTVRFSRTYCVMYKSGIPVLTGLQAAGEATGNSWISAQFSEVMEQVENGSPLSAALSRVDGFDRRLMICLHLGEESGRTDDLLSAVADSLENEVESETKRLVSLLEPVMIVVMAVVVGFVLLSVMLPLYQSYELIGMGY